MPNNTNTNTNNNPELDGALTALATADEEIEALKLDLDALRAKYVALRALLIPTPLSLAAAHKAADHITDIPTLQKRLRAMNVANWNLRAALRAAKAYPATKPKSKPVPRATLERAIHTLRVKHANNHRHNHLKCTDCGRKKPKLYPFPTTMDLPLSTAPSWICATCWPKAHNRTLNPR